MYRICCLCLCLAVVWAQHQPSVKFELSVDNIMRGPGLYGYAPQDVRWSGDGKRVYFRWKRHDEPLLKEYSTYVVNRDGSGLRRLSEDEEKDAPPLDGHTTRDWKLTVFSRDGDIYLYDQLAGKSRRLTKTADVESNPAFTHDEKRIIFLRSGNLFVSSPGDGSIEQLTDIRAAAAAGRTQTASDEEERKGTQSQEYLKKQERELLEIVSERAKKREEETARKKKENPRKPWRLTQRQSVSALYLSPDESYVLASIRETAEGARQTVVPNYITESGYTADISSREKVGDVQARYRLAFVDVKTGDVRWLDHGLTAADKDGKPQPREVRFGRPMWSDDGGKLIVMARAADNKDAWILALDPAAAKARVLVHMHDDAWIGGPGRMAHGWLKDNERVWFIWERDGWAHLYTVDFSSGQTRQLTSGPWEVRNVELTARRNQFLLTTSEVHPGEDQLYFMRVDGGDRRRLTRQSGGYREAALSPDETMLAAVYSYTNKPPELQLIDIATGSTKTVTTSPAPDFSAYPWLDVPIVEIPARDGAKVPARIYKPKNWKAGGPLVIFVHGAGYLQNVHRQWSTYAREYLFHHLLMERGYLVLDLDYRGSAGYGRDWRTAIYRHMGGKDLDDQVDAVKWAVREYGVDPRRVGIYGGSYGGFLTLMAMFTQPDVFAAGAALRPVTDWAHYNHGYTSNILNLPYLDAEAYRRSSPIYHAAGLKGALLICHGMADVNVHFQDTVRLVQRLIELRKENWELAVYPAEDHSFLHPASWADEYKRILKLFETHLRAGRRTIAAAGAQGATIRSTP